MARISTYSQDPNLEGQDRVIGSDVSNANATMNFSLASLGDFFTRSGLADATRLGYRFNISQDAGSGNGSFTYSGSPSELSLITNIRVGLEDLNSNPISLLNEVLGSGGISRIKLISTRAYDGTNTVPQGYFTVTNVTEIEENNTVVGYNFMVSAIAEGQVGSFVTDVDTGFIIVPLPSNAAGTGGGTGTNQNLFDAIVFPGGTSESALSTSDDLVFANGTGISITPTVTQPADGVGITVSHGDTSTLDGVQTTASEFINSITVDSNGHITAVGTSAIPAQTQMLDFPTLSGNYSAAGFGSDSHTFSFGDTTGFTITNFQSAGSLTGGFRKIVDSNANTVTIDSDPGTIGTRTFTITWTATQTDLPTHTRDFSVTRTYTIYRPYYTDVLTSVPGGFVLGTRQTTPDLTNGGTIRLTAGAGATQEAVIGLSLTDHPTPTFRTGGFLVIDPEATFDGTAIAGENYRNYVISLTPNSVIDLEII